MGGFERRGNRVRGLMLGVLAVLSTACGGGAAPAAPALPPLYFDLTGFLDTQRDYLESVSPGVTRTVLTDGAAPETQRRARVAWDRELALFYEADINKPALRGLYTETATPLPDGGTRRTYQRQPAAHPTIRELTVETAPDGGVRRIAAVQDEQNALFASERHLTLRCDPAPDRNRLLSYDIKGKQKLVFFAPTTYEVRAEIE